MVPTARDWLLVRPYRPSHIRHCIFRSEGVASQPCAEAFDGLDAQRPHGYKRVFTHLPALSMQSSWFSCARSVSARCVMSQTCGSSGVPLS